MNKVNYSCWPFNQMATNSSSSFFFAPLKSIKVHLPQFFPPLLLISAQTSTPISPTSTPFSILSSIGYDSGRRFRQLSTLRKPRSSGEVTVIMFAENQLVGDACATAISGAIAVSVLRIWQETAKRGLFDQKLNRKLVHVSIGLVFMLCWPLFSSGHQGALFAALIPGANIIKMLLMGLGIWKDEATVKSMSRFGDYRELLKGPLYYASTITLACAIYWRSSPIAIAAICNLCAGDGLADIVGRRFGSHKLPYNRNKSIAGSIAMMTAGFIASVGYMHYFAIFGYLEESWEMVLGFLVVSLATTLVESHPISTELDDNLTVPLAALLVGVFVL